MTAYQQKTVTIEIRSARGVLITTVGDEAMLKSWLERAPRDPGLKFYKSTTVREEIQA